jgi:hypothetical protein
MISSHRVYISGHPFFVETEFFNSNSRYHSLSRFEIRSGIPPLSTSLTTPAMSTVLKRFFLIPVTPLPSRNRVISRSPLWHLFLDSLLHIQPKSAQFRIITW